MTNIYKKSSKKKINYRKIYEKHFGKIPKDEYGRSYEIHHIDGNHNNNEICNLQCISIQEHFDIHLQQKDYAACLRISDRMNLSAKDKSILASLNCQKMLANGTHPWQGSTHNQKMLEEGIHPFLDKDAARERALKRLLNGEHHWSKPDYPEKARKNTLNVIKEGRHNSQIVRTCPHCNKTGNGPAMLQHHFDNCKFSPNYKVALVVCPHCNNAADKSNSSWRRFHFDNCKHSPNYKLPNKPRAKPKPYEKIECPHCSKIGIKSNMLRWHFDNCKTRK